jgi:hypothetical protein
MAIQENFQTITLVAGADLSERQYRFVSVNASGEAVAAGAGANAIGVLQNDPVAGQAATIAISGVVKVEAGGAVTRGGQVASGANGVAANAANDNNTLGTALETGANGRIISMLFQKNGIFGVTV